MSNTKISSKTVGRRKASSSTRKRPITTWLSPAEIAALVKIGHKGNAQDGIRVMAKAVQRKPKKPSKLSRSEGRDMSVIELDLLPLESERLMSRRLTRLG